MADTVSDTELGKQLAQMGAASPQQLEAARLLQAECARGGTPITLAEALLRMNAISEETRDAAEIQLLEERLNSRLKLGNYRIIRKLGAGGMGTVFLAEDEAVGRPVALKVLPRKYASDREFITRFRREARAAGKLSHPNIVSGYTVGEDQGSHFFAMEYCEGEALDARLLRDGAMSWEDALEIVRQAALGLRHAHEKHLIHRDIKPANIFITKDGTVKILDLGLSKNIGAGDVSFHTQTGIAMGTPHYMSPEQVRGDKAIDGRTDIYSLGATLYQLVTGRTPFEGSVAALVIVKHLTEQLPDPRAINPKIPTRVVLVIQKMMAREPSDRYANCSELLEDLDRVMHGHSPDSRPLPTDKSSVMMGAVKEPFSTVNVMKQDFVNTRLTAGSFAGRKVQMASAKSKTRFYLIATAVLVVFTLLLIVWHYASLPPRPISEPDVRVAQKPPLESGPVESKAPPPKAPELPTPPDKKTETSVPIKAPPLKPPEVVRPPEPPPANPPPPEPPVVREDPLIAKVNALKAKLGAPDAEWIADVRKLPADFQVDLVDGKTRELNPRYQRARYKTGGSPKRLAEWMINDAALKDVSALGALETVQIMQVSGALNPVSGAFSKNELADLTPLKGLKLVSLSLNMSAVEDLSPLAGMPLTTLDLMDTRVSDLSPLRGMKLNWLQCAATPVKDLSPLENMPITYLNLQDCARLDNISPLASVPLEELNLLGTHVTDLTAIEDLPLSKIILPSQRLNANSYYILRYHPTLLSINGRGVEEYFAQNISITSMIRPFSVDEGWVKRLGTRSAEFQGRAMIARMKKSNYGKVLEAEFKTEENKVVELTLKLAGECTLTPLRALTRLERLILVGTGVSVKDLSALRGLPVQKLDITGCQMIGDVSVLKSLPLKSIKLDFAPTRDKTTLKAIKTLETINETPANEFWQKNP